MDYKDYIEEARKYLSDTGDRESYRKYYEDAMNGIKSGYADSVSELEKAYRSSLNEAAANSDIRAKNNAQFMASRGLSRSGEAEQENILRSLSLNGEAERLAGQKASKQTELRQNAENAMLELEKERAKYEDSERKRLEDNALAIAKVQYSADREDEQNALEDRRTEDERRYTENLTRLKAELAEAAAEKEREFKAAEDAKKREYDSAEAEKKRNYESSESAKKREYDSAEAEKKRSYESSESAKKREYDSAEAEKKRSYESSESAKKREYDSAEAEKKRSYESSESAKKREYDSAEAEKKRNYESSESAKKREYDSAEAEKKRSYESSESAKKREHEASESAKKREQESEILKTKLEHEDKQKTGPSAEKETGKAAEKANDKTAEKASGKTGTESGETAAGKTGSTSSEGSYEPKQTAASLAKQVVKSQTKNNDASGLADRLRLSEYIDDLRAEGSMSVQYIKDLETALGSYGYKKPSRTETEAKEIYEISLGAYNKAYKNSLESYKKLGAGAGTAPQLATKYATMSQLSYIYDNSESTAQFNMTCELAGIDENTVKAFFKEYGLKDKDSANKDGPDGAESAGAGGGKSSGGNRTLPGDTINTKY